MFRFTIRELLILTVTAGLAVGWWIDHGHTASIRASRDTYRSQFESLVADLQRQGILVKIENDGVFIVRRRLYGQMASPIQLERPRELAERESTSPAQTQMQPVADLDLSFDPSLFSPDKNPQR